MAVGDDNDRHGPPHLDRVEVFSTDPARLFAALEVVEPVVGRLRRRSGRLALTTHARLPARHGELGANAGSGADASG